MADPTETDSHSTPESTNNSTPGLPQPGQTMQPGATPPSAASAPVSSTTASPASTQPQPQNSSKKWLGIVILLVVLIVVGAVVASKTLKSTTPKTPVVVKKDIPVLNVGYTNSGGVPQYPIAYPYANDSVYIALQLFEGLVGYQNQTKVVPLLATDWSNPNDTTWVFNLRHDVKFHSGRIMTATDVKYTLDYVVAHQSDDNTPAFFVASSIKDVTVTGPYQVTVTTNSPDGVLLNQLSLLGIVDSKATLGDYNAGTGPYMVKTGTTPTSSSIQLIAFNNYWGGHVYTRAVNITLPSTGDELATDTAAGKYDLAGDFNSNQLSKIKNYRTIKVPDQGLTYIGLNTENAKSPLSSLAARQALAEALNIPAILKASGLQGQQDSQIVPLLLPGHNSTIQNTAYNPDKAKELLASVSNLATPITFAYSPGQTAQVNEIAKELTAVGFNVKLVSVSDFNTLVNDTLAGKYDLFTESDTSATVDGLDILTDLLKGNQDYSNPKVDSLIAQAGSTLNPADRISDMQQIATMVATDKPIIPLYTLTRVYALTKPYTVNIDLPSLVSSVYLWKVYQ